MDTLKSLGRSLKELFGVSVKLDIDLDVDLSKKGDRTP